MSTSVISPTLLAQINGSGSSSSSSGSAQQFQQRCQFCYSGEQTISQSGFLQLISTQMQNQDPLNPTDPTQFLSQIEGLSEVSSLQGLQTSISGLATGLQSSQMVSGTSLLGHRCLRRAAPRPSQQAAR